ncbi:hypothetical protein LR010_02740, partial [Candidatus Gracilibacteria bacterium]|nr:hypothetical protein [Candidatus Gracilibacteria bacterium]
MTQVYIQEYSENYDSLGTLQKWRYQAYLQVGASYPDWSRYVSEKGSVVTLRTGTRNVFNKGYYFEIQNENLWVDDL